VATVQRYVNTASSGGDGTTNATSGSTAAYASLSSWEANSGGSATDDYVVDCCGTAADTTAVAIDFAVNITSGTVLVRGNRSDGAGFYDGSAVISTSHYRLDCGNVQHTLNLSEVNITVDGIQVISGHTGANGNAIRIGTGGLTVRNCRVLNGSSCDFGIGSTGSDIGSNNSTRNVENNLVVGFDVVGIDARIANNFNPTFNILHNTVYGDGSAIGIRIVKSGATGAVTFNVKGNACANNGDDLNVSLGSGSAVYADNAFAISESTTDEIALGTTTDAWTSPGTSASNDFTVKDTSSTLYNAVNPTLLSTDITGFTRDGTNHDVGAFEYQSTGYTLAAGQGSYALSGQAVGLGVARRVSAEQGSYALTGQAAGLHRGFVLLAEQGTYLLSGQAAALQAARAIAAGQGSYALSGQPAGLLAGRSLTAAQGAYALSGQDATLTYAAAGSYLLVAAQGTYALSGQAAGLVATRRLSASQGSYAIAGQAATLSRAFSVVAATGEYSISGQAAALMRSRALTAEYGAYGLTGQVVTLTYSGVAAPPVLSAPPLGHGAPMSRRAPAAGRRRAANLSTRIR
jgi:hypothetical protein